jgi:hypothetical protein
MQRVVELALEAPFELRVIEIARMQIEIVGVNGNALVFERDDDFNSLALGPRRKIQQRMFVECELSKDAVESRGGLSHPVILADRWIIVIKVKQQNCPDRMLCSIGSDASRKHERNVLSKTGQLF